jgi:small multidrug resistance pump
MVHFAALVASILIGVLGQVSLKAAAMQDGSSGALYLRPYTLAGLLTYFVAAVLYIYALQKIPLSVAFPSVSISYVVVSYIAHLFWGEPFGLSQLVALALIGAGILILSRG